MRQEKTPNTTSITRTPFPASQKVYVKGEIHDIQVAMREICLHDSHNHLLNKKEQNEPLTVYDTSGPYTDPDIEIDVQKGLPKLRASWISDRNDTVELAAISSAYGKERLENSALDPLRFEYLKNPRKAKPGSNV